MREAVGIPAGLLSYFMATVVLLLMFGFVLPNPREWSYFITISTTFIAFKLACAAAISFSTETGVKVVALMLAAFWLVSLGVDVFNLAGKVIDVLSASKDSAKSMAGFKDMAEAVWNTKVCAVVTAILAVGKLAK